MKYIHGTTEFHIEEECVLSLGKFDGLHRGHETLLEHMMEQKNKGCATVLFTFAIPPRPGRINEVQKVLTTNEEKVAICEEQGIDYLIEYPFTKEVMTMEPEAFIEMLASSMKIRGIVVGTDFHFGHNRRGDYHLLEIYAKKLHYELKVIDKVQFENRDISSTFIREEVEKGNKILITTLTKRMAEDLTDYMKDVGIRVRYLHSDIDTLERAEIIRDMRLDVFDVLVGINLLREGLDIPEITLVAILDADKEGFLRSEVSLIQTIGRAARNSEGHVIMYADVITDSMRKAIQETERRRNIQEAYNKEHGITPTTIKKAVRDLITVSRAVAETEDKLKKDPESMTRKELTKLIGQVEKQMRAAAADLNFEQAAELRDKMIELKKNLDEMDS